MVLQLKVLFDTHCSGCTRENLSTSTLIYELTNSQFSSRLSHIAYHQIVWKQSEQIEDMLAAPFSDSCLGFFQMSISTVSYAWLTNIDLWLVTCGWQKVHISVTAAPSTGRICIFLNHSWCWAMGWNAVFRWFYRLVVTVQDKKNQDISHIDQFACITVTVALSANERHTFSMYLQFWRIMLICCFYAVSTP